MDKNRRFFLKTTTVLAATGLVYGLHRNMPVWAQQHMPMGDMGHNMGGMQTESTANLPVSVFPTGKPLMPLSFLKNESTQAKQFIATLTASAAEINLIPGHKPTTLWLYNQGLLPLIDVSVGDEILVTFNNRLTQDGTIHWHGLAVPPEQDGNPQDPVSPNQSRQYRFKITEEMAGTHWFHPHTHGRVAEQVYRGLAGAFIVRHPQDPLKHIPEQHLFFSDLRLDKDAQIPANTMMDQMNGREGQFALINGLLKPVITLKGTQRWRLWNGNSARYLDFQFPDNKIDAYLVGSDGGLLETPRKISNLLLTPGERAEIVLTPKNTESFEFIAKAYDRKKMGDVPPEKDLTLATINMVKGNNIALPQRLRVIEDFAKPKVKQRLVYTENQMDFYINGKAFDMNRLDLTTRVGQTEEWEIVNESHMDHNFHLHGTHFLVKEFEFEGVVSKPGFKLLKDTVNLRPNEIVRILTQQNIPGIRMYHCHILEHEDAGMMGQLKVA